MSTVNPTCSLPPERHGEILGRFTGTLELEEEQKIRSMFPQYLFFRNELPDDGTGIDWNEGPVRICTCTACGQHFAGVRANYPSGKIMNEPVTCPYCYHTLTGKAAGKYSYDMPSLSSWVKTAVCRPAGDGALLIEAGHAHRSFTQDNLYGDLDWFPNKRYYLGRGAIQMWERQESGSWKPRLTVTEPFQPNLMGCCDYHGEYIIHGLTDCLPESDFRYCMIQDFYHYSYGVDSLELEPARWMLKYLAWYTRMPQMEIAVKYNIDEAVHELISQGKKNCAVLNWKGFTPAEFMRMSRADARAFRAHDLCWKDLKNWKAATEGMSLAGYLELADRCGGLENLKEIGVCADAAGVSLEGAVRYIDSLRPQCSRGGVTIEVIIRYWKDYLSMGLQLGYDLTEKTVTMPKNLQERHDLAAENIKVTNREREALRYRKRRRKLEDRYAFRMGGLCIKVPVSAEEIQQEGNTLHHCVGGYAARHLEGKTTILFLRRCRKPLTPYLTIELREDRGAVKIEQIHGYKNEIYRYQNGTRIAASIPPREKFGWFLEPWLQWVNAGSVRDRDGNPILPEAEKTEEIKTA